MTLQGKGIFIWKIPQCEGGNAQTIANVAKAGGFSHVLIKIADATSVYNTDKTTGVDLVPPVVDALKAKGIQVWGWHYIYGYNPLGEAAIAISQTKKYRLDGYLIDAEVEFQLAGRDAVARTFMTELRKGLPSTNVGLSSFRWPSYHPTFPYKAFLEKCDVNMPQVYWMQAHNPIYDLTKSYNEFKAMMPTMPMVPTGPAFAEAGWQPTPAEVKDFLVAARSLGMTAANLYSWDDCRTKLPPVWDTIVNYSWPAPNQPPQSSDILDRYIFALNTMNFNAFLDLYAEDAVLVTAEKTIQGNANIRVYFGGLLTNTLNDGVFSIGSSTGTDPTRHFTWTAVSSRGKVLDGSDTFGLQNGKIAYHYSHFTVTP
jgi:hypothetical protein